MKLPDYFRCKLGNESARHVPGADQSPSTPLGVSIHLFAWMLFDKDHHLALRRLGHDGQRFANLSQTTMPGIPAIFDEAN
jgi:hypothetical protein